MVGSSGIGTGELEGPQPPAAQDLNGAVLAQLGVEVWRLGQRLGGGELSHERLEDSFRRLIQALGKAGVRIDDPNGLVYVEGMNAEVIGGGEAGSGSPPEALVIAQVLRPAVFVNDVCMIPPQVVIGARGSLETT